MKICKIAAMATIQISLINPSLSAGLTPTTAYFSVENFYVPNLSGDYVAYSANGFFEPGGPKANPRLFLLPRFTLQRAPRIFDANGIIFDAASYPDRRIG